MKYKIIVDKQPMSNPSEEKREYEVDIEELRYKGDVYDELIITKDDDYVVRRLSLSEYEVLTVLDEPVTEPLEDVNIELFEGDNYVYVKDMVGNRFYAKYIIRNDFTDSFVVYSEMFSAIDQMADEINVGVSRKLEEYSKITDVSAMINVKADEINESVDEKLDITTTKESSTGTLTFQKINTSEPIHVEIRPLENITYLYPRTNLYPSTSLYPQMRVLRFTNTTTNEAIDYELPDNLLYYNSSNYDTFVIDYKNKECYVNKKCGYNSQGNVVLLANPVKQEYEYPTIGLTEGDYTVQILKYENTVYSAYMKITLMEQNERTSQFATKVETDAKISTKANEIDLRLEEKLDEEKFTGANITMAINDDVSSAQIKADKLSLKRERV